MFVAGDGVAGARAESDVTADVFGAPLDEFLEGYPDAKPLADGAYELKPGARPVPPGWSPGPGQLVLHLPALGLQRVGRAALLLRADHPPVAEPEQRLVGAGLFVDTGPNPDIARYLGPNSYLNLRQNLIGGTDFSSWNDRIDEVLPC